MIDARYIVFYVTLTLLVICGFLVTGGTLGALLAF